MSERMSGIDGRIGHETMNEQNGSKQKEEQSHRKSNIEVHKLPEKQVEQESHNKDSATEYRRPCEP